MNQPQRKTTVTLICDSLHERIVEWRKRRDLKGKAIGTFAAFRDRLNGARFTALFPQYAGQTITYTYGEAFTLAAPVAEWLFKNGYLQPKDTTPLWK